MAAASITFTVATPLLSGRIRVVATANGVLYASFHEHDTEQMPNAADLPDPSTDRRSQAVTSRLADYFSGKWRGPGFNLPIDWSMTSGLQRQVLQCLVETVPFGQTITYGALAERCGAFDPALARTGQAARVVGTIMGTTPIAILIPAHRVVAADGIGGFGNGPDALPTKRWLLTLEGSIAPTLDWDGPDLP